MLKGRPDWCVSRQRVWGVPIPAFYCRQCQAVVTDANVIRHVADIFERESADAWYTRTPGELLPEGFKCATCESNEFTQETDILDVWFDSGSSSIAVLENRDNLRWPADIYIEGGDQFRGWFNSSLFVALAVHNRAPYKGVITHGWTLDAQGRAMHKSAGNAVPPEEVIKDLGADILRLWCTYSNYQEDVRCSAEILEQVAEGYRKLRNTARYALGNLDGFDPVNDSIPEAELLEIDRWALAKLDAVIEKARAAYEAYEFHVVYRLLFDFSTVTLSARYFDILKDRLYTFAPGNPARRSAQTVLFRIADALARLLAPILVYTADEIWEHLPGERSVSVHLEEFPRAAGVRDEILEAGWERVFEVRDKVLRSLEEARVAKTIGSSLEAAVEVTASGKDYELLERYAEQLRYLFIVSQATVVRAESGDIEVNVGRAVGEKCERCWNYSPRVGESERYPTVCERCVAALTEIEAG